MLHPSHRCDLLVEPLEHPRGQAHLSAASGLAIVGDHLLFVADDEHHLGILSLAAGPADRVRLHRLRAGDLPPDARERKRRKPDLEAVVLLPGAGQRLLALGSGSTPDRMRGFLLETDARGTPQAVREIDLARVYQPLAAQLGDLNIEGAFVAGTSLCLLARANRGTARNALIRFSVNETIAWLAGATAPAVQAVEAIDLGDHDGVPYGITDAAALPQGGWIFSAVAEDTSDSYADGACVLSAVGWMSPGSQVLALHTLAGAPKVEGVALAPEGRVLLVTDADDPARASALLELPLAAVLGTAG